jgi:hypothetical protein
MAKNEHLRKDAAEGLSPRFWPPKRQVKARILALFSDIQHNDLDSAEIWGHNTQFPYLPSLNGRQEIRN